MRHACACLYVIGPVLQLALREERLDDIVDEGVDEGVAAQREHLPDPIARAGGPCERRGAGDHRHAHPRRLLDLHGVQLLEQGASRRRLHGHRRRERHLHVRTYVAAPAARGLIKPWIRRVLCVQGGVEQTAEQSGPSSITHHGEAAGDGLEVLALAGTLDVVSERGEERQRRGAARVGAPAAVLLPGQNPPRHHAAAGAVRPERAEAGLQHHLRPGVTLLRRRGPRRRRRQLLRRQLADDRARRGRHGGAVL
jgi:hypothetical protein